MRPVRKRKTAEVNIVPLVDVLTVLIFFFLITMNFESAHEVTITPPEIESAENGSGENGITISINKNGTLFLDKNEISFNDLSTFLKQKSTSITENSILIIADEDTYLKSATTIFDLCKQYKFKKIRLKAR